MLDGSEIYSIALFQADMPLIVALLTFIPVKSRQWAGDIHPARIIPHGDISELV